MSTAISAQNLGKRYLISHQLREPYTALRDVLAQGTRRLVSHAFRRGNGERPTREQFWALQDVTFDLEQGDRVGIIGRNGAGKSTLLKILSRITEPTTGRVRIDGRVASLLEVGTGFHPELTGRENIFLNGAILGMRRAEIRRKFDAIVAFAEVEKFLDTPVKRYSSGMYVRLAFSVAAHLEPEILIVDEVLAVGDAQFQQKCIGRMQDVGREGRTVVFVSHNMAAIQSLCSKGMLLSHGRMIGFGSIGEQVQNYLASIQNPADIGKDRQINMRSGIQVKSLRIEPNPVVSGCPVSFMMELASAAPMRLDAITILISTYNRSLAGVVDLRREQAYRFNGEGSLVIRGEIRAMPLVEGAYGIGIYVRTENQEETVANVTTLDVLSKATEGQIAPYPPEVRGVVELDVTFAAVNER
jgi:lipopolysaccharide transport system ATP-binding protein